MYVRREQQSSGNFAALSADRINDPDVAFQRRTVHDSSMKAYIIGFRNKSEAAQIVQTDFTVIHPGSAPLFLFSDVQPAQVRIASQFGNEMIPCAGYAVCRFIFCIISVSSRIAY